jgi:hypothetical protein
MIRQYVDEYLEDVVELINEKNIGETSVRYYPSDRQNIISKIKKRRLQPDVLQLINIENSKLVSYVELLEDKSEKYLQLLAHFSHVKYNKSLHDYFCFILEKYKGYSLHYVLSDFNTNTIKFMKSIGATDDGYEKMMHIAIGNFKYVKSETIYPIDEKHKEQFCKLHNQLFKEAYWTGELLLNEGRFDILVSLEEDKINGYVVISCFGNEEEEIYFIYADNINTKINLYREALNKGFRTAQRVQVLLSHDEEYELPQLESLGFTLKESIITFFLKI